MYRFYCIWSPVTVILYVCWQRISEYTNYLGVNILLLKEQKVYLSGNLTHFYVLYYFFIFYLFYFIFCFLGLHLWHMEIARLGVQLELQLLAYARAMATSDSSHVCNLHHSSWQSQILNTLRKARDWTCNLKVTSQIRFWCVMRGTLI